MALLYSTTLSRVAFNQIVYRDQCSLQLSKQDACISCFTTPSNKLLSFVEYTFQFTQLSEIIHVYCPENHLDDEFATEADLKYCTWNLITPTPAINLPDDAMQY